MRNFKNDKLFLEADQLIGANKMSDALEILHEILNDDPSYARAHNHIGWIYDTQMLEYFLAEDHYKHAIHFSPEYPSPYFNYFELLYNQRRFSEAESLLNEAMSYPTINKMRINYLLGRLNEASKDYDKAIYYYNLSTELSSDQKNYDLTQEAINRCQNKEQSIHQYVNEEEV